MMDKFFANLIFCLIIAGGLTLFTATWMDVVFAIFMVYAKQYLDET